MYKTITEGKVTVRVFIDEKVRSDVPVFYNPIMEFNRSVSVALLKGRKKLQVGLPLAASGVRGIRFLTELPAGTIKSISMNDSSAQAVRMMKKNIAMNENNLKCDDIEISQLDANIFMLESTGFDYIDIDPFGSPNRFLDSAIIRLARDGILAVTATDTAALSGTYPAACRRKYWANPRLDHLMHETGIRMLARKVQLIGAQYEKALVPIYSYARDHYYRIFFECKKGKRAADSVIEKHKTFNDVGPMWSGDLWNVALAKRIAKTMKDDFTKTIAREAEIKVVGFYDLPSIAKKHKVGQLKPTDKILKTIRQKGHPAERTHFSINGIRTTMAAKKVEDIVK